MSLPNRNGSFLHFVDSWHRLNEPGYRMWQHHTRVELYSSVPVRRAWIQLV